MFKKYNAPMEGSPYPDALTIPHKYHLFCLLSNGDVPLKILYPQLFMCAENKEACISEVLSPPVGDNDRVWSLRFYREFNDWELEASYSLLRFLQSRFPRGGGCDRLCWDLNGSGKFDIRSLYHKIRNVAPSSFPWKGI